MEPRQGTLTGFHCHHATDARLRPNCEGFATVAYGRVALCGECDLMRSAVGREHSARKFPGADLDRLTRAVESLRDAERSVAEAVGSARRGWRILGPDRRHRRHHPPGGTATLGLRKGVEEIA